jgi:hypothetical protein
VDDAVVTERDTNNNFFVTAECIGRSRATVVTEMLKELNEDVNGFHVNEVSLTPAWGSNAVTGRTAREESRLFLAFSLDHCHAAIRRPAPKVK